jgi:SP family sugar:H+ symporter-like MFS transporter
MKEIIKDQFSENQKFLSENSLISVSDKYTFTYNAFRVYFQTINASMGSFIIGYNLGVFDTVQVNIAELLKWTNEEEIFYSSLISSSVGIGAIFGSLAAGYLMKNSGRKNSFLIFDIIALIGITLTIILDEYCMIAGRAILGICVGGFLSNVPVYVIEYAPYKISGKCGMIYELNFSVGVLLSYTMSFGLPEKQDEENQWWRIMLAFPYIIVIFNIISFLFYTKLDTPKYNFLIRKDIEATKDSLKFIYKTDTDILYALKDLEHLSRIQDPNVGIMDLFSRKYRKRFFLILVLLTAQQLCGVDVYVMFSQTLFMDITKSKRTATFYTFLLGVVQFIAAVCSIFLIEKLGRKLLLVWGQLFIVLNLAGISALYYFELKGTLIIYLYQLFMFLNGISLQPIASLYTADILPETGVGIAMVVNNIWNFLICEFFLYMIKSSLKEWGTIGIYAISTFLSLVFTILYGKETKNLSPRAIERLFDPGMKRKKVVSVTPSI